MLLKFKTKKINQRIDLLFQELRLTHLYKECQCLVIFVNQQKKAQQKSVHRAELLEKGIVEELQCLYRYKGTA